MNAERAVIPCAAIAGVYTIDLETHRDHRGAFTELFRESWIPSERALQWNAVRSLPNTLRGIHAHLRHADYLTVAMGRAVVALKDLRRGSATWMKEIHYTLDASASRLLHIPVGVAHGFWFPEASLHVYAVTEYFDPADELSYRWDDPGALLFPEVRDPLLSPRDAEAPPFEDMLARLEPHQERLAG